MKKSFPHLVLAYGLFLGWLLSFLYNGPAMDIIFNSSKVNIRYLAIAYILTPSLIFFYIGFYNIKEKYKLSFMKYGIIFCLIGTVISILCKDLNASVLVYFIAAIMGIFSVIFITGWGCYFVELLNIKEMYKSMAYVICLGYIIFNTNEVLKYNGINNIVILSLFLCLFGSFFSTLRLVSIPTDKKQNFNIGLPVDLLVMMCFLMFLLNVGGGVVQTLVSPMAEESYGNIHMIDIGIYFSICSIIYNTKIKLPREIILTISIVMIACGYLLLIVFTKSPIPAYVLIILGYAILDIFIWTLVGEMGYIFGNPIKVFTFTMASNLMAVFMGNILGGFMPDTNEHMYMAITISAIGAILAFAFLPFINNLMKKGIEKMNEVKDTRDSIKGIVAKEKAVKLLTCKELEIYKLMLLGLKNKDIAKNACISENTLKGHARNIYFKFGVRNKKELLNNLNKEVNS